MCNRSQSAFHGKILELPGIFIDNFENASQVEARAYFLSHCHTDHMQGLNSSKLLSTLEKTGAFIYTTELTAAIIKNDLNERILNHIRCLKIGSTLISLPCVPEKDIPELFLTVTLIPASHSAGSTMFLFKTITKTILYTGDFRINCNDLPKYAALHVDEEPIKLDALYVDTTFLDSKYENFPKRSESIEKMCCVIKKWLSLGEHNAVAIHTSAKYGYEFAFNEIYKKLGHKVYVHTDKWNLYRHCEYDNMFLIFVSTIPHLVPGVTNNEMETRIHLCKNKKDNADHITCLANQYKKYLFVSLSAMKWMNYKADYSSVDRVSSTRLDVCFATHCSRTELLYFVNYLSPNKVYGFPNYYRVSRKRIVEEEFVDNKKNKLL